MLKLFNKLKLKNSLSEFVNLSSVFKYGENTFYLTATNAFRTITGLIFTFLLAREYGPSLFGTYSYVLSIVLLVSIFPFMGLQCISLRELVEYPENKDEILGTCGAVTLLSSFICFSVFSLFIYFCFSDPLLKIMGFFMGLSIMFTPLMFILIWYQAQVKGQLFFVSTFLALFITLFIRLLCIYTNQSIISFSVIYFVEFALLGWFAILLYKKYFCPKLTFSFNLNLAKKLLSQSWPLILSGFAVTAAIRIDQIMIGMIEGNHSVGIYSAASKVSMAFYVIPQIITLSLFPAIVNSRKRETKEKYYNKIQCFFDLNVGISYLVIIFVLLFSTHIINLIYGDEYDFSSNVLSIHIWSNIFFFLGISRSQFCIVESLIKFEMISNLLGCVLNIVLNLFLIPSKGIIGAAYATIISQMTAVILICFFYRKTYKLGLISINALYLRGLLQNILKFIK